MAFFRRASVLAVATLALAGCAETGNDDQQAANDTSGVMMDTAMQGMNHAPMMNQQGAPARDANHEFLRMMSDHHEGLVLLATQAMDKGAAEQTRSDAHSLHTKQAAERDSMVAMISRDYQEQYGPKTMPENQAQADSLSRLSGQQYDRAFYRIVIDHHREGVRMMDQYLPRLTKPELKQMVEKMKSEQQKEISQFQRKAGS